LYKLQLSILKKALKKHNIALQGKKVLDIGCGTGFFSEFYLRNLAHVTGIDITTTSVESLRDSLPDGKFITMDFSAELTSKKEFENQFDIINMLNVIFHIVDDTKFERTLENLILCLKEGGYLLLSDYRGDADVSPARHVKFRRLAKYQILREKGVNIVDIIPVYYFMNRKIGTLSVRANNLISPLLFIVDYIITKLEWLKGKDIKLLVGRKQY
jgi:2-polyprenyl-3-methyl-5-hydroxy-6-metoxy-1,4-benzoquinol methylase